MPRYRKYVVIFLCLFLLAPSGCKREFEVGRTDSTIWENMPAITYGVMEYERLNVVPWYSGRAEATSLNRMAETETGYYQSYQATLYYADKVDYTNWLPVCSSPDCDHISFCDAEVVANQFIIRNNRIIYEANTSSYPHLYSEEKNGSMLISMTKNGKDKQLEYVLEDALIPSAGYAGSLLTADCYITWGSALESDGSLSLKAFYVTEENVFQLCNEKGLEPDRAYGNFHLAARKINLRGDPYIYDAVTALPEISIFRFEGEEKIKLDVTQLSSNGSYISGSILRYFMPNDGYYDRNIETGEEVRLADARLSDSTCDIVLPNCIIESNFLGSSSVQTRPDNIVPAIEIFDGEVWHSITLPKELEKIERSTWLSVLGVTSDSIFLGCRDSDKFDTTGLRVYRIEFGAAKWQLEFQCEILPPHVIAYLERMEALKRLS